MDQLSKQTVSICAWCQKEHPTVDQSFLKDKNKYNFSHGICRRHALEMMKGLPTEKIEDFLRNKGGGLPDLKNHPELVQSYSQGNWFPNQIKERFQKLANINI